MQPVKTAWHQIPVASAVQTSGQMEAFWAFPQDCDAGQKYPAIVVLMEIFGVNDHMQAITKRLAHEGFVTLAINYYHRQIPHLNLGYGAEDVAKGRQYKDQTRRVELLADVEAAIQFLETRSEVDLNSPIGTIGFCFGGHVGFLASTLPKVQRTVVCYGAGIPVFCPGEPDKVSLDYVSDIDGELLFLLGQQDPLIPEEQVEALRQGLKPLGRKTQMVLYPEAGHGFFCDARPDYHPDSAQDGWNKVVTFLKNGL